MLAPRTGTIGRACKSRVGEHPYQHRPVVQPCDTIGMWSRGPAPVRRFLPKLIDLVWNKRINPGKVFDLTLPLEQVAEGYRAMDERRAIKTLLRP